MAIPPDHFQLFSRYANERLKASAFHTDPNDERSHLFHTSLDSTNALMSWTAGATNARGEVFEVVPGFVDIYRPNAFADRFEGQYYIGLYSAMLVAVSEFAMYCFTQADFMPGIGDPDLESSPLPEDHNAPGLWLINLTKTGGRVGDHHSERLTPRCDKRYAASIYLALLMTRFAWLHELAHAFNGHVAYIAANNMSSRINEVAEPSELVEYDLGADKHDEKVRERRCLEFDADQSALWASVNIQLSDLENVEGIRGLDERVRVGLSLFGAYAMTWLFGEFQAEAGAGDNITHPAPHLRLQNLVQVGTERLSPRIPYFDDINREVCRQFDAVRNSIPGIFLPGDLLSDELDGSVQTELFASLDHLQAIREALREYQFTERQR